MKNSLDLYTHYFFCQDGEGGPVELPGPPEELALLAYGYREKRLVKLTTFPASEGWTELQRQEFWERAAMVAEFPGESTPQLLQWGNGDGLVFYTSPMDVAQSLRSYLKQNGGIPAHLALRLLRPFCQDLVRLQSMPRLFRCLSLEGLQIVAGPSAQHPIQKLQMTQIGLPGERGRLLDDTYEDLVARDLAKLTFSLLCGQEPGQGTCPVPETIQILERSPDLLRLVKIALGFSTGRITLAAMGTALADAEAHLATIPAVGSAAAVQPNLREIIFGPVPWPFPGQFVEGNEAFLGAGRFSYAATDTDSRTPVTLHPIPGKRFVPRQEFRPVPANAGKIPARELPNVILPTSCWTGDAYDFVVENRLPGLSLEEWLQEGKPLTASELLLLAKGIQRGCEQAAHHQIPILSLHPADIFLHCLGVRGREAPPIADTTPRIRVSATLRGLLDPWYNLQIPGAAWFISDGLNAAFYSIMARLTLALEPRQQKLSRLLTSITEKSKRSGQFPEPLEMIGLLQSELELPAAQKAPNTTLAKAPAPLEIEPQTAPLQARPISPPDPIRQPAFVQTQLPTPAPQVLEEETLAVALQRPIFEESPVAIPAKPMVTAVAAPAHAPQEDPPVCSPKAELAQPEAPAFPEPEPVLEDRLLEVAPFPLESFEPTSRIDFDMLAPRGSTAPIADPPLADPAPPVSPSLASESEPLINPLTCGPAPESASPPKSPPVSPKPTDVPKLLIDLERLTTADSIFSSKGTYTIRKQ